MKRKRVVLLLLWVAGLVLAVSCLVWNWQPVRSNHLIRQSPAGTNVFGWRTWLSSWRLSGQQRAFLAEFEAPH
jgi:hypothetical protein